MRYQETAGIYHRRLRVGGLRETGLQQARKGGQAHLGEDGARRLVGRRIDDLHPHGDGGVGAHVLLEPAHEFPGAHDLGEERVVGEIAHLALVHETPQPHGLEPGRVYDRDLEERRVQLHDVADEALLPGRVHGGEVLQVGRVGEDVAEVDDVTRDGVGEPDRQGLLVAGNGAVKGYLAEVDEVVADYTKGDQGNYQEDEEELVEQPAALLWSFCHK